MTKIKICGIQRTEDAECLNELGPDYAGFVFVEGRRRYIEPERAAELRKMLLPDIRTVGVFIDEDPEKVLRLLEKGIIDLAQLHGSEDEEYVRRLKERSGKPVIKVFRAPGICRERAAAKTAGGFEEELLKWRRTVGESPADFVLLDTGAGTGKTFDWEMAKGIKRKLFLAGGLDASNVLRAIETLSPYGIDVSSGVETGGIKDPAKIRELIEKVRKEDGHEQ